MRTLKLTYEQIELINDALKLAESRAIELSTNAAKLGSTFSMAIYKKSNEFYDLNAEIKSGKLDV